MTSDLGPRRPGSPPSRGLPGRRRARSLGAAPGAALALAAAWALAACTPTDGESTPLDTGAYVDPAAGIAGTVTAGGTPVAGAHVTTLPHAYEATTGDDGSFTIDRLPADAYRLLVAAPGLAPVTTDPVDVAVDEVATIDVDLVEPPPTGSIAVTVTGPDGAPVPGATVAWGDASATTDGAGFAQLPELDPGSDDLEITATGLWPYTVTALAVADHRVEVAHQLSGKPPADARYVGSRVCLYCHLDNPHPDSAHAHALSTTTSAGPLAGFALGRTVALGTATATLAVDGAPVVRITAGTTTRTFPVAGWIGDQRSGAVPFTELGDQAYPLPVAWVAADPEFPGWPERAEHWAPYQPERWVTGSAFTFAADGHPDPAGSADGQCLPCHATGFTLAARQDGGATLASAMTAYPDRWGEAGVGCERCHGPGSAHAQAGPSTRRAVITNPARLDTARGNDVCGQCHSRVEAQDGLPYPHPFQPGERVADHASPLDDLWSSGAAAAPGQQLDELKASPHGSAAPLPLRCDDCHQPHGTDAPGSLWVDARDNGSCLVCHAALTFGDDAAAIAAHPRHLGYQPATVSKLGRCTACHMAPTAARLEFHASSGAGDLSSHVFTPLAPQDTLDAFGASETLPLGSFPAHACSECHAWAAYRYDQYGIDFLGPAGDPTQAASHREAQAAFEEIFP